MEDKKFTTESIKYGVIAGLIFTIIHIGSWTMGTTTYVSVIGIETFVPYMIGLFIFAGFNVRKQNGGFLSFKEAMKFIFLAFVIVALIEALTNYILFNVLDKDLTAKVLEITREKSLRMMQKLGLSKEQIDASLSKIDTEKKETGFKTIFLGLGISLIWNFVKSMLISIIVKKDKKLDDEFLA